MKILGTIIIGSALVASVPMMAQNPSTSSYQSDQDRDRDRNTQAYNDGYAQGQADARSHSVRNDRPTTQWSKDDDQRAYRQGYDAGFENVTGEGRTAPGYATRPGDRMGQGDQEAEQFGYQDGLAAGRQDQMKSNKFKPEDHDLYKEGTHGWTSTLGTKEQFRQLYRQNFIKGYEQGYRGAGPQ
jgi:hypothetical protein